MFFIDVHSSHSQKLDRHIEKYSFRKNILFDNLTEGLELYAIYSDFIAPESDEGKPEKFKELDEALDFKDEEDVINIHGYTAFTDPRTRILGTRAISPTGVIEPEEGMISKPVEFYNTFRRLSGVCEGKSVEGQVPHTLNFHLLNSLSFNKGCYVGQELVARTHTQGVLRTTTLPFIASNDEISNTNTGLIDENYDLSNYQGKISDENGNFIGQVLESDKNIGIAKIKIEASQTFGVLDDGTKVYFWRPTWMESKR